MLIILALSLIHIYNLKTGDLKHYESSKDETNDLKRNELANDWVNYIYCDSEGLIWLGDVYKRQTEFLCYDRMGRR